MEVDSDYLNCRTCRVRFAESAAHRDHFKSEWHLYNIKRKVIKLAPISVEEFVERQLLSQGGSCVSSELGETDW
ncbi:Oidioi.mRNA.OKI2018_I69.chr1.g3480.t2.cds [Oikopleura dioica]|nr:Oidioi.mRNA.OKI2018_I69.chr1.g3480.t2.cds [Oikopleura dioica]